MNKERGDILVPTNSTIDQENPDAEKYFFELGEVNTVALSDDCTRKTEFQPIYLGR